MNWGMSGAVALAVLLLWLIWDVYQLDRRVTKLEDVDRRPQ